MGKKTQDIPWYFVCQNCNCKFFHSDAKADCPRCGESLLSNERIQPPWRIRLYSAAEAAEILAISKSKVYELVDHGKIGHHRMDGTIRISEEQLAEYLETTKQDRQTEEPPKPQRRMMLKHLKL